MSVLSRSFLKPLAVLVLSTAGTNAGSAEPTPLSGIYSNLRYNSEGGDLLGMELLILPGKESAAPVWTVVAQVAEGGAPCVSIASLRVAGADIEFTLPRDGECGELHFRGKLIGGSLRLWWDSGSIENLKRGKSYWQ